MCWLKVWVSLCNFHFSLWLVFSSSLSASPTSRPTLPSLLTFPPPHFLCSALISFVPSLPPLSSHLCLFHPALGFLLQFSFLCLSLSSYSFVPAHNVLSAQSFFILLLPSRSAFVLWTPAACFPRQPVGWSALAPRRAGEAKSSPQPHCEQTHWEGSNPCRV